MARHEHDYAYSMSRGAWVCVTVGCGKLDPDRAHVLITRKQLESTKAAQVPLGYEQGFADDLNKVAKKYNGRKRL